MTDWLDIYKNEKGIIKSYKDNVSKKVKLPPGYTEQAFRNFKNGDFNPLTESLNTPVKPSNTLQNMDLVNLKRKKLWELSISPAKSILMNGVMMYMSPNGLQLIPIMMTMMLFVNAIKEIFQVNPKFANADLDEPYDLLIMKTIYILCCSGNFVVGLWKLNSMGLVPNSTSDWLSWEPKLLSSEIVV